MKLYYDDSLGITDTGTIHVDDYMQSRSAVTTLCGISPEKYETYDVDMKRVKLCKKCQKSSAKKGYDLVATLSYLKLKRI